MDQTLDCTKALENISQSAGIIRGKWSGIMAQGRVQFRKDLFNEKIRIKYLIGTTRLYEQASNNEKKKINQHYLAEARKFLALPRSTSNAIMRTLVGDIGKIMECSMEINRYKVSVQKSGDFPDDNYINVLKEKGREGSVRRVPEGIKTYTIFMTKVCLTHKVHLCT